MVKIAVQDAGKLVESAFKAACGSTLLLEAVKGEWQRITRGMTEVGLMASGDLAIGSLKCAMDKVQTRPDQRANLIGMFCNEWNLLTTAEAHRATENPMQGARVVRSPRP